MKLKVITDPRTVTDSTLATALKEWNWFVNSKKFFWFVVFDEVWLAYGGLSLYDSETVYLGPDFVVEHARGQCLQLKLIRLREKWARKYRYKKVLAITDCNNIYSANNFIKAGYILRKPWPGFSDDSKYLWFTKEL